MSEGTAGSQGAGQQPRVDWHLLQGLSFHCHRPGLRLHLAAVLPVLLPAVVAGDGLLPVLGQPGGVLGLPDHQGQGLPLLGVGGEGGRPGRRCWRCCPGRWWTHPRNLGKEAMVSTTSSQGLASWSLLAPEHIGLMSAVHWRLLRLNDNSGQWTSILNTDDLWSALLWLWDGNCVTVFDSV